MEDLNRPGLCAYQIELGIFHFDAWDWNIMKILNNTRQDDTGRIRQEVFFEGEFVLVIVAKVVEHLLDRLSEFFVQGILVELICEKLEFADNLICIFTVPFPEQETPFIIKFSPFLCRRILQNITLFAETFPKQYLR